jgi:D-alanyl-D-alanine carboxypeptidase
MTTLTPLRFLRRVLLAAMACACGLVAAQTPDSATLTLSARAATVTDLDTGNIVFEKSGAEQHPVASLTKLMSAMVLLDQGLPMDTPIRVDAGDRDILKGSHSRLAIGAVLTRRQLLTLALVASDNRAILALARTGPGGIPAFVDAMNAKARHLGLRNTHFVEPSGLSPANVSTAEELARLAGAAYGYSEIRALSTTARTEANVRGRRVAFRNTNSLVADPQLGIGLTKTGFINEAGRCVLVVLRAGSRHFAVALLGAPSGRARSRDLLALHEWLQSGVTAAPLSVEGDNQDMVE